MSKITNPTTEASISCGFYNGLSGDVNPRKYDAMQMSKIFDGIIKDGVFASIGDCFIVTANSGTIVNVGTGKCWFNHTWTENDAPFPIDCGPAEELLDRIDTIVIRVDASEPVRDNFIEVIHGKSASNPVKAKLTNTDSVHYYPVCYIYRTAGVNEIAKSDLTNAIGVETPYITGILETINPDKLVQEWSSKLDAHLASEKARTTGELNSFVSENENDFNEWYSQMKTLMNDAVNEVDSWTVNQKNTILDWFEGIKGQLSTDAAVNLQLQIDRSEVERILVHGFVDGHKTFSNDSTVITSVDSSGRTLVKTFTNEFLTSTTVLTDSNNTELGRLVKNFSSDGRTISSEITTI